MQVIWFKRDFRLHDHEGVRAAMLHDTPVLMLAFVEPELEQDAHYDVRHWQFVLESVQDMNDELKPYGGRVHLFHADPRVFFTWLFAEFEVAHLWSYQEVGIKLSFERDKAVKKLCDQFSVDWTEFRYNGVVRGARDRKGWQSRWKSIMEAPILESKLDELAFFPLSDTPFAAYLSAHGTSNEHDRQRGGRNQALACLKSFLDHRHQYYPQHISKPQLAQESCSRLSPYLAWGNLSLREVWQQTKLHQGFSIRFFQSRLTWHDHFIQKFESEHEMEFRPVNQGYADERTKYDPEAFDRFCSGMTGFPLVDACVRCLRTTGYLNFRMRAMLVSFWTHHLWQDWRPLAKWLAAQFLDFEPGIHYGQIQMQTSMTGINTVRIYNPVKQSYEHDPDGRFIQTWVPELAEVPTSLIHEPWKITPLEQAAYGLSSNYPAPMVDIEQSGALARKRLWTLLRSPKVQADRKRILAKHTFPGRKPVE